MFALSHWRCNTVICFSCLVSLVPVLFGFHCFSVLCAYHHESHHALVTHICYLVFVYGNFTVVDYLSFLLLLTPTFSLSVDCYYVVVAPGVSPLMYIIYLYILSR
ncbi:hypothetical protein BDP27DRAFT_331671 [Rhodocollybia butyracea]|uniref:Uncharacterized protein n=1 Tax=Rhodocollybia butyracea TaxID=206335 RepID=A0A9P5Q4F7_9AGAR|nr:hypothetical protein BDP27DRAFT_331671 [Rhodocollybia butyracea]